MCGRYTSTHQDALVAELGLALADDAACAGVLATAPALPTGLTSWWAPRWNIAPTQPAPVVVARPTPTLTLMRWGLVPAWADALRIGVKHINARAETVAQKAPFRDALRRRRCLVAADGFYEWRRVGTQKQPFAFAPADGAAVTFAGLWDRWRPPGAAAGTPWIESFTILTTAADALVTPLHDRMPRVIAAADRGRWLSGDELPAAALADLLTAAPLAGWTCAPAEPWINASGRERGAVVPAPDGV